MKKKNKKVVNSNKMKNINANLGEITIGEYLEDEVNKIMLKVKYRNDLTLDIKDLIQNNITIQDIPVISTQNNTTKNSTQENIIKDINQENIDTISKQEIITPVNIKENITSINNKESIKDDIDISISSEEEVAATEFINLEAENKKIELERYLEEEHNFKEFDKKLVEIVRQRTDSKNSSFGRFLSKFFLEDIRLFK